jgi:acyl carrier protein
MGLRLRKRDPVSEPIFQKVVELIVKGTKIPRERIKPDSTFEELGLDSLDATTLLYELEETFDVQIPNDALKVRNVREVVEYLERLNVAV